MSTVISIDSHVPVLKVDRVRNDEAIGCDLQRHQARFVGRAKTAKDTVLNEGCWHTDTIEQNRVLRCPAESITKRLGGRDPTTQTEVTIDRRPLASGGKVASEKSSTVAGQSLRCHSKDGSRLCTPTDGVYTYAYLYMASYLHGCADIRHDVRVLGGDTCPMARTKMDSIECYLFVSNHGPVMRTLTPPSVYAQSGE